jgi:hypothetical protein
MHVRLISVPQFDWHNFVNDTHIITGVSPTRGCDNAGIKAGSLLSLIPTLAAFRHPGSDAHVAIQHAEHILQHITLTFLCEVKPALLIEILKLGTDLLIDCNSDTVFIATANLRVWKNIIVEICQEHTSYELRIFFNLIYFRLATEQHLKDVWSKWSKQGLADGTLVFI